MGRTRFSVGGSSDYRNRLLPLTPSSWTADQPVRFLLHIESPYTYTPERLKGTGKDIVESRPGLLLRRLPPYRRRVLEPKGLVMADDVMVHSVDPDFGRAGPYIF